MNYKLTKREKVLLYALLCIVLVVVGWIFLLEPSLKENRDTKRTLATREGDLMGIKVKYQEYSDAPLNAEKEKKKFIEQTKDIYGPLSNEDIDKMLTELVLRNGLIPQNLAIEEVSSSEIAKYNPNEDEEEKAKAETTGTEKESIMKSVKVSLSTSGSLDGVKKVADEIATNKGLSLRNFNFNGTNKEDQTIVLNFIIYTMEK